MKLVYSALDGIQAKLIQDELAQLGVPTELFNQHSASGLGELPASYPQVWVKRNQDEHRAKQFITRFEARLKQSSEECVTCPNCDESNPTNFETCWACSSVIS